MKSFKEYLENKENQIFLWLDDLRPMPHEFNFHAKTAQEAINILKTGKVIKCSLDHDLGPEEAGTGYLVAKWIEENAFHGTLPQLEWNIHSQNNVGVRNMQMALENADKFWQNNVKTY